MQVCIPSIYLNLYKVVNVVYYRIFNYTVNNFLYKKYHFSPHYILRCHLLFCNNKIVIFEEFVGVEIEIFRHHPKQRNRTLIFKWRNLPTCTYIHIDALILKCSSTAVPRIMFPHSSHSALLALNVILGTVQEKSHKQATVLYVCQMYFVFSIFDFLLLGPPQKMLRNLLFLKLILILLYQVFGIFYSIFEFGAGCLELGCWPI